MGIPFLSANLGRRQLTTRSEQQYKVQFNKWGLRKNKRRMDQRISSPETGKLFTYRSGGYSAHLRCHKSETDQGMVKSNQPGLPPAFAPQTKCHTPTTTLTSTSWDP